MRHLKIIVAFSIIVLIAGCASVKKTLPMDISSFTLFETVSFEENISKAFYHNQSKSLIAMEDKAHRILIIKDGKQQNAIGGLGSYESGFMNLADVALGKDGFIYALDSTKRQVKRFSLDGKKMVEIGLDYVQHPYKLALGSQHNLFVYDRAASEIIAYDLLDGSELYRFGRFQLDRVDHLFANKEYVVAYDKESDKSTIFYVLGQKSGEDAGQVVYDDFNNAISLSKEALVSKMSAAYLPMIGSLGIMTMDKDVLAIVVDNQVRLLKVDYAPVF